MCRHQQQMKPYHKHTSILSIDNDYCQIVSVLMPSSDFLQSANIVTKQSTSYTSMTIIYS